MRRLGLRIRKWVGAPPITQCANSRLTRSRIGHSWTALMRPPPLILCVAITVPELASPVSPSARDKRPLPQNVTFAPPKNPIGGLIDTCRGLEKARKGMSVVLKKVPKDRALVFEAFSISP